MVLIGIVVAVGMLFWGVASRVGEFTESIAQMEQKKQELAEQYPFTPPEDPALDEARFVQYLGARDQMITQAEDELDWLLIYFDEPESGQSPGFMDLLSFPFTVLNIGSTQMDELGSIQMSVEEYSFITRQMMAELYAWKQLEDGSTRAELGARYFMPLETLNTMVEQADQTAGNVDLGPFSYNSVVTQLEAAVPEGNPNQDLLMAHSDEVVSSSAAILIDAFSMEFELSAP